MAGVTHEDMERLRAEPGPGTYAWAVRFRWWLARFIGSLSDGSRAVMATALLAPVTFLAIFLVVTAVA